MSDPKNTPPDEAAHGGGIGTIGRQPVDPSTRNGGDAEPAVPPAGDGAEAALTTDPDGRPSDEDADAGADETLGTTV